MSSITNTQLKALSDLNLATNGNGEITAAGLREVVEELIKTSGGMAVYVNSNTTPQNISSGTWTQLEIDGLGTGSISRYPYYITSEPMQDNSLYVSEFKDYSIVHWRSNIEVVTTTPNQGIHIRARGLDPLGAELFSMSMGDNYFKSVGTYEIADHTMIYGHPDIIAADGRFIIEVQSTDGPFTALFQQALVRVAG